MCCLFNTAVCVWCLLSIGRKFTTQGETMIYINYLYMFVCVAVIVSTDFLPIDLLLRRHMWCAGSNQELKEIHPDKMRVAQRQWKSLLVTMLMFDNNVHI